MKHCKHLTGKHLSILLGSGNGLRQTGNVFTLIALRVSMMSRLTESVAN
jgi:hypothetical protein